MVETEIKKKITLEEFMELRDENLELIDGYLVKEPTPTYEHQRIVGDLLAEITLELRKSKLGEIVVAPITVLFGNDVLQPDLLFISTERLNIVIDGKVTEAPDVTFEIISPFNAFNDTKRKFDIYEQFGVKEYFIIYPDDKTVVKYSLINGKYHEEYQEVSLVKSDIIGCNINF